MLYFCSMVNVQSCFIGVVCLCCCFTGQAQSLPTKFPAGVQRAVIDRGDTIALVHLREVFVYPPLRFSSKKAEQTYNKLVRDVKYTLPYAKLVFHTLIETYEYMETLPDDKAREKHLKRMEKELFSEYKPHLKRLSLSQGKLLIKLIDRECNQSSYNILRAYLGSFKAGFWNFFAGMFGANLKTKYDPKGKDALTERVVILVENGLI
ncbi:MAG: DUF4294 domain-containing protein [Bacteroidales bacterium]